MVGASLLIDMRLKILVLLMLLWSVVAFGQVSYFNSGFLRQPSALLDRQYLGITNFLMGGGVTFTYVGTNAYVISALPGGVTISPGTGILVNLVGANYTISADTAYFNANYTTPAFVAANYYPLGNPSGYISGNQTITLSGDALGSGTTAITVAVTNLTTTPSGTVGQVLTKTAGGIDWSNASGSASVTLTGDTIGTGVGTISTSTTNLTTTPGGFTGQVLTRTAGGIGWSNVASVATSTFHPTNIQNCEAFFSYLVMDTNTYALPGWTNLLSPQDVFTNQGSIVNTFNGVQFDGVTGHFLKNTTSTIRYWSQSDSFWIVCYPTRMTHSGQYDSIFSTTSGSGHGLYAINNTFVINFSGYQLVTKADPNVWYHLVASVAVGGRVTGYTNLIFANSTLPASTTENMWGFGQDNNADQNYQGYIKFLAIYTNYSLTAGDLYNLYTWAEQTLIVPETEGYVSKTGDTMTGDLKMLAAVVGDYSNTNNVFGGITCSNITITNQWPGWSAAHTELNGYGLLVAAPIGPTLNMEQLGQGVHPAIGPGTISFVDSIFYPGGTIRTGFWVSHPIYARDEMRIDGPLLMIDGNNGPNTWVSNGVIKTKTNFASTSFVGGIYYGDGSGLTNLPSSTNAEYVLQSPLTNAVTNFTVSMAQLPDVALTNFDTRVWTNNAGLYVGTNISIVPNSPTPTFKANFGSANTMVVTNGQVAIGKATPTAGRTLDVSGDIAASGFIRGAIAGTTGTFSDTTESTSPTSSSSLKTSGGLSVAKQITSGSNGFFGGQITATNGVVQMVKGSFVTNFTCTTNLQFYLCDGTNQIVTLPNAANVPNVIYRFSTTNGYARLIVTNATGAQTIRDGTSLSYTNIGIAEVGFVSDGAHWWLASRGKLVQPVAQFSCTTNIPITLANTAYPITFNSIDFDLSQGIVLAAGTNGYASKMWITNGGIYEFDPSIVVNFNGNNTVTIWFRQNGVNIANSATAIKGAPGGSIRCVTIPFVVNVGVPAAYEMWVLSSGTGDSLSFQAAGGVAPNDFPLSPSVICPVKRISDTWP